MNQTWTRCWVMVMASSCSGMHATRDAGESGRDAGVVVVDAGEPEVDGGAVEFDAGTIDEDAGIDAGDSCIRSVTDWPLITSARPPAATSGGTLARMADGSFVAADAERSRVSLVSADLLTVRTVPLTDADEPGRVIDGSNGHAYVVLRRASQILDVNLATGTASRLTTCQHPRALGIKNAALLVGCLDGTLERLDPVSGMRTRQPLRAGVTDLRDIVVDGETVYVTTFRAAELFSVAADGGTTAYELPSPDVEARVAWRAVGKPDGGLVVVRQLHSTRLITQPMPCKPLYGYDNLGDGIPPNYTPSTVVRSQLVTLDTEGMRSRNLGYVALPIDVAVSAGGLTAVVSPAGVVRVLTADTNFFGEFSLYIGGTAAVFDGERLILQLRESAELIVVEGRNITQRVSLGGESVNSTGGYLFNRGLSGSPNIACASCHPEGGDDGHTWRFAAGLRRTPSLRGGIKGSQPFQASGDLADFPAVVETVLVKGMGARRLTPELTEDFERWIDALPRLAPPLVDVSDAAAGQVVFDRLCVSCHQGPLGTNNSSVSVGSGGTFQVPRLTELAWQRSFFHDGRFATLDAMLTPVAGGDQHGAVSTLSATEKSALISYLRTR